MTTASFAQDEEAPGSAVRERMTEYIQKRLGLSKGEADRFSPVFLNYFNELRRTNQQFKADRLVLQQKIVELRINYRDQFKNIVGEKRSNDVFRRQDEFIQGLQKMREEQTRSRKDDRPNKRFRALLQ